MSKRTLPQEFNTIIAAVANEMPLNYALSGSCALYLMGLMDREPHDIDFVYFNYALDWEQLFIDYGLDVICTSYDGYSSCAFIVNGIKVDFIHNAYSHRLGSRPIEMEEPFSIIREKWRMAKYSGQTSKHQSDIADIMGNLLRINADSSGIKWWL